MSKIYYLIDVTHYKLVGCVEERSISSCRRLMMYDYERDKNVDLGEDRGTYDLDFQHRWQPNAKQEYIWGVGFSLRS